MQDYNTRVAIINKSKAIKKVKKLLCTLLTDITDSLNNLRKLIIGKHLQIKNYVSSYAYILTIQTIKRDQPYIRHIYNIIYLCSCIYLFTKHNSGK